MVDEDLIVVPQSDIDAQEQLNIFDYDNDDELDDDVMFGDVVDLSKWNVTIPRIEPRRDNAG